MELKKITCDYTPVKKVKVDHVSLNEKSVILNVYNYFKQQNPSTTVDSIVEISSKVMGYAKSTVYKILKEEKSAGITPPKPRTGRPKLSKVNVDEFFKNAIRRMVHSFFLNKQIPTLGKVLQAITDDPDLPTISRDKLWKVLHELNFKYEKVGRQSMLIDSEEIVCWRRDYLRKIKKMRTENKNIYYLDETWVNEGHTVGRVWNDKTIKTSRQAFLEGYSTGFKEPTGKGRRLIVTHIGSMNGFLKEGLLLFESKKTCDYHEEMNGDVFEEYFEQMIEFIPKNSVIVMDNASYHSRLVERLPTTQWRKDEIAMWLTSKNLIFDDTMTKAELLALANINKQNYKKYVIEEIAKKRGIEILRLPPYHCELNPIELVWAEVKGNVARNNTTFKLSDVTNLFHKSISEVTTEHWQKCINHVMDIEKNMWELDRIIDSSIEPIIISLGSDDNSSETEYEEA